jgi:uncharacterized membrane protein
MIPLFVAVAYAQGITQVDSILESIINNLIRPGITLLTALAVVYFVYGVFEFVKNSASEDGVRTGGRHIIWGIIGLFIMVSAWGIIGLICNTVGCQDSSPPPAETQRKELLLCWELPDGTEKCTGN